MLVGWAVLSPLSKLSGWAPGPVGDMSNGARGWILWVSLGIMCADSLVSLVPVAIEFITDIIWSRKKRYSALGESPHENHETETEDRLVPNSWVATGLFVSIVVGTFLVWVVFGNEGIKPWATLCGFVLGGLLSIIGWVLNLQSSIYLATHSLSMQSACAWGNRFKPSVWPGQDLAVIFCVDPTWQYRSEHYCWRCGRGWRTAVSSESYISVIFNT